MHMIKIPFQKPAGSFCRFPKGIFYNLDFKTESACTMIAA